MLIAELCQNHLGSMEVLREMVAKASEAGATFAKIQSFFADDLSDDWKSDYDRLKALELTWEEHATFAKWCKEYGLTPMTSVYTFDYADELNKAGIRHIKIGSAQSTDEDLITQYIATGFHVYVSTGGTPLAKVSKMGPLAGVFHCVSEYPANPYRANLIRLFDLKRSFPGCALGFSDHTDPTDLEWSWPAKLAMLLGVTYVEKHFTVMDRSRTKDGKVSIDFGQLKELVRWDRLSLEEKLREWPTLGAMVYPQDQSEIQLIDKYRGRWKRK
jgi:sialic acid synthase SpsE